ncbi:hypothetical protein MEO93_29335, partial [Dolichospermum sp. ST_sed3]|nr:hypothetical protein [Dolichospermum sp. ST_sed3]
MKKMMLILGVFVFVCNVFSQQFVVGELKYNITSVNEPRTVEVIKKGYSTAKNITIPENVQNGGISYSV